MNSQAGKQESRNGNESIDERIARMVIMGLLGGMAAGILVGGVGGRLIMRILAMLNEEKTGVMTGNGNLSGDISVGGTLAVVVFVGIVGGLVGGAVYVVIRRWLPGDGLLKGLAYGLVLTCLFGSVLFDPDNVDFVLFGPKQLTDALFALLFPLYGVVASLVIERLDRYVPPPFAWPSVIALGYFLIAGFAAFGLFPHGARYQWNSVTNIGGAVVLVESEEGKGSTFTMKLPPVVEE